jgi:leucyl aminopeptidase (aminopeptidase T)
MEAWEAAKNALECVLEAEKGEGLVIFCDDEKMNVGNAFAAGSLKLGLKTHLVPLETKTFRKEIPKNVQKLLEQPPAIYVNLLRGIREEAIFRIELVRQETEKHRSRLGHCPGVTLDMLTHGALALKTADHRQMQDFAKTLIKKLGQASRIEITNPAGTCLSLSVENRPFFTDTMVDRKTLKWMNLPTGEVLIAPMEDSAEGVLICDMAIGGIGPIHTPVRLTVKAGQVRSSSSDDSALLKRIQASLGTDENSSTIGEFAFGINPKARFVEEFLEAEKLVGTIHIAFGNNADFPEGKNPSKNHMDFLISKPTVKILFKNNSSLTVLSNGVFCKL